MDGLMDRMRPAIDTSCLAGRITSIVALLHERAVAAGDWAGAQRFDASLDTIYFAALLLSVDAQTGSMREGAAMLEVLDTASEIVTELRGWIAEAVA